ncbi:MAG: hypothetical protein FJZ01_06180 [Candidatus Sericytochromatia bacterium]|nr:hypothetical protein [Candidatus Tanganyikabacteria bacterium]
MIRELSVGARTFGDVRKVVLPGEKDKILDKAKAITDGNGLDEIFFKTSEGDLYVAYLRGSTAGVKNGYFGRFAGHKVEIVHVGEETNTFREGLIAALK